MACQGFAPEAYLFGGELRHCFSGHTIRLLSCTKWFYTYVPSAQSVCMLLRTPHRVAVLEVIGKMEEKGRHNKHCLSPDLLRGLQGATMGSDSGP